MKQRGLRRERRKEACQPDPAYVMLKRGLRKDREVLGFHTSRKTRWNSRKTRGNPVASSRRLSEPAGTRAVWTTLQSPGVGCARGEHVPSPGPQAQTAGHPERVSSRGLGRLTHPEACGLCGHTKRHRQSEGASQAPTTGAFGPGVDPAVGWGWGDTSHLPKQLLTSHLPEDRRHMCLQVAREGLRVLLGLA